MTKLDWPVALLVTVMLLEGCARNPASVVRRRAQTYTQLLLDDKFDEAVNYYDPDVVTSEGRTAVTDRIKIAVGFIKGLTALGGRRPAGFAVRNVDVDSTRTRATAQVVFVTTNADGGDRKEHPVDQKWILKNKSWYATP